MGQPAPDLTPRIQTPSHPGLLPSCHMYRADLYNVTTRQKIKWSLMAAPLHRDGCACVSEGEGEVGKCVGWICRIAVLICCCLPITELWAFRLNSWLRLLCTQDQQATFACGHPLTSPLTLPYSNTIPYCLCFKSDVWHGSSFHAALLLCYNF